MVLEKFVFIPNPESKARNRSILPDLNLKKVDLIFSGQVQVFLEWPETWPEKNQVNLNLPDWPELTWTKIERKLIKNLESKLFTRSSKGRGIY